MLNLRYCWYRVIGVSGSCCGGDVARERREEGRRRSANVRRSANERAVTMAGVLEWEWNLSSAVYLLFSSFSFFNRMLIVIYG